MGLALSRRWLFRHVVFAAGFAVLVVLGRWQWHVAMSTRGDLRNLAYALQWWAFGGVAIYGYSRVFVEEWRESRPGAVPRPRRTVGSVVPAAAPDDADDPELAAYNRMLADLNARSARR